MNYKINQRIAYNTSNNYYSAGFLKFGKIKSIAKNGIITLENGLRFNKFGKELKSKANPYPSGYLTSVERAEEEIARQEKSNLRHKMLTKIKENIDSANDATLQEILNLLNKEE